jgi:WD40 repeat protein
MNKKAIGAPKVITQGHYSPCRKDNNEVWGLVSFPRKELYVTVSDDCTLRVWDAPTRKQIRLVKLTLDAQGNELPLDPAT